MKSNDVYIAYVMSYMWVIEAVFKKWVIAYYSRMKWKFKIFDPFKSPKFYAEFIGDK